jgi:hypothetical protein
MKNMPPNQILNTEPKKCETPDFPNFDGWLEKNLKKTGKKGFLEKIIEKLNTVRKIIANHFYYTVCMDGKEEAVYIFRVCNDRVRGILCYDEMNIDKLKIIKIKNKEYLPCPKAHQVADKSDFEKYEAD